MSKIDYNKILNQILKEHPHNLDAIKDLKEHGCKLEFRQIVESSVWSIEEKTELLKMFNMDSKNNLIEYKNKYNNLETSPAMIYYIKNDKFDEFRTLVLASNNSGYMRVSLEEIICCILNSNVDKEKYLLFFLDNIKEEDIEKLFKNDFHIYALRSVVNKSMVPNLIYIGSVNVAKKIRKYIEDVNLCMAAAIKSGNVDLVKYLIDEGADVNFVHPDPILDLLTPIKVAIECNDKNMYLLLKEHGANLNLQTIEPNFEEKVLTKYPNFFYSSDFYRPSSEKQNKEDIELLEYYRSSTPMEYAITLKNNGDSTYMIELNSGKISIEYKGKNNKVIKNSDAIKNRQFIIDDIYYELEDEDRKKIDFTLLIANSIIAHDIFSFNKYVKEAKRLNTIVDANKLINIFWDCKLFAEEKDASFISKFIRALQTLDKDDNIIEMIMNKIVSDECTCLNENLKYVIDLLSDEDKKKICIMPYCKNIKTCQFLINKGFDINQKDSNGETLLFYVVRNLYANAEFVKFVIDNSDLSIRNNKGYTALYYGLQEFPSNNETKLIWYSVIDNAITEQKIIYLINKMDEKDVCDPSTTEVINWRNYIYDSSLTSGWNGWEARGQNLYAGVFYHAHKGLYDALAKKGFRVGKELALKIADDLNELEERNNKDIKVDIAKSREMLFTQLDANTDNIEININEMSKKIIEFIDNADFSIEDNKTKLKDILVQFDGLLYRYKDFAKNVIPKKHLPEEYIKYMYNIYGITFNDLDYYAFNIIIKLIDVFGDDDISFLSTLLPLFTSYDKKYFVDDYEINNINELLEIAYGVVGCDDNGEEILRDDYIEPKYFIDLDEPFAFTGTVMQYAILKNKLEVVKLLRDQKYPFEFLYSYTNDDEAEDFTWYYVTSTKIEELIKDSGKKTYGDLKDDEVTYYQKLIEKKD